MLIMCSPILTASLTMVLCSPSAFGESSSSANSPAESTQVLAASLREVLLRNLPAPLYEGNRGWGHTTTGPKRKNDGTWQRVRITAETPAQSLVLTLQNIQQPEPGKLTFQAHLACDTRVDYEHQHWKKGIRILSGGVRARMRLHLDLACEVTAHLEQKSSILPEVVFHLRVAQAQLGYDHFVVEHVAGIGGEAAKLLGEAVRKAVHYWRPAIEQSLLTRANAAIVKAADSKEVHIGLIDLFKGKLSTRMPATKYSPRAVKTQAAL